jgi:hypothetical protein
MSDEPTNAEPETVYHVATGTQFEEIDADDAHCVDDDEYAVVWGAERLDDTTVRVEKVYCEAGLNDTVETYEDEISDRDAVNEFLGQLLRDTDKIDAIEQTREYWRETTDAE